MQDNNQAAQLAKANAEVKRLREGMREQADKLDDAAAASLAASTVSGELAVMRQRKAALEDKHRALAARYDALHAEHTRANDALASATGVASPPRVPKPTAAAAAEEDVCNERSQQQLRCFGWVVACIAPPKRRADAMMV